MRGDKNVCVFKHSYNAYEYVCVFVLSVFSSLVSHIYAWVFPWVCAFDVRAHFSERSQDMASGLLGVLGTIF